MGDTRSREASLDYAEDQADYAADQAYDRLPHFTVPRDSSSRERNERNWTEIFASIQRRDESVEQYSNRILALADELTDLPHHLVGPLVFCRVKAGLVEPIKRVLRTQIVQPTSHAALNDVAMIIEESLRVQDIPAYEPPLQNGTQQRTGIQEHQNPDQAAAGHSETINYNDTQENPLQILGRHQVSRVWEVVQGSKRKMCNNDWPYLHDRRKRREPVCYICWEPGHRKGQCPQKRIN
ncbi:MAG: hypothetical protein Q9170_004474 [Blastenia crenularia]